MNLPLSTTKISGTQLLLGLGLILGVPLYVLWPVSSLNLDNMCMDGMVSSWVGEYPEPVIVIRESVTLQGMLDFCSDNIRACTVAPRIIHPWSKNSDIRYATKTLEVRYRLQESMSSNLNDYIKGQEIIFEGELSSDVCSYRVGTDRWTASCAEVRKMEHLSGDIAQEVNSFFYVSCSEGYSAWIEVQSSLFDDLRIDKGVIKGYGSIAEQ